MSEGRESRDLTSEVNCNSKSTNFFLVVGSEGGKWELGLNVAEGCLHTCENEGKLARMCVLIVALVSLFCKRSGGRVSEWWMWK